MTDISDLSETIKPKSDQLNADDLLTGTINLKVTDIKSGPVDQPVHLYSEGRQPYKPCKIMRRVLITAWGDDGRAWVGREMTLYCDPTVKWGGVAIGGIRISHLSHITCTLNMMLTESRGRKTQFVVKPFILDNADHKQEVLNFKQELEKYGWTVEQVLGSFNPPLKNLEDVQDISGCIKFLKDNKMD